MSANRRPAYYSKAKDEDSADAWRCKWYSSEYAPAENRYGENRAIDESRYVLIAAKEGVRSQALIAFSLILPVPSSVGEGAVYACVLMYFGVSKQ